MDEVDIDAPVDLDRDIHFSVFGRTRAQVYIEYFYEFKPSYDQKVEGARPVADQSYAASTIADEYGEGLVYSYAPWWGAQENRTVVLLADVIQNKLIFYARWNVYPKHFLTALHAHENTIAVYGDSPQYHSDGKYFVRVRPDFVLADLISGREYMYNMYLFSQTPNGEQDRARQFEIMELGQSYLGFSNRTSY
jgi:hypothetical protein